MAAKFDATSAVAQGFKGGDGIPVDLTIPTRDPWVPLRILATAKAGSESVSADVFLLTDQQPALLHGDGLHGRAFRARVGLVARTISAATRTRRGCRSSAWFTYGRVDTAAKNLTYDLAIDARGGKPRIADTGVSTRGARAELPRTPAAGGPWAAWLVVGLAAVAIGGGLIALTGTGRTRARARRTP